MRSAVQICPDPPNLRDTSLKDSSYSRLYVVVFRLVSHKFFRGHSSAGRAPALHAGGQRFDPAWLHHFPRKVLKELSWESVCLARQVVSPGSRTTSIPLGSTTLLQASLYLQRPAASRQTSHCSLNSLLFNNVNHADKFSPQGESKSDTSQAYPAIVVT